MRSVAVRLAVVALFVLAAVVSANFFWTAESRAKHEALAARAFETAAYTVERQVLDLRAAQQAYVAAGQGDEFWITKVATAARAVRTAIDALKADAGAPAAQAAIDNAASAFQDFEQLDRRAREYARNGQKLLASDLIFADGLETTGAVLASIEQARVAEVEARDAAMAAVRRAGLIALGAAGLVGVVVSLLLVPRGPSVAAAEREQSVPASIAGAQRSSSPGSPLAQQEAPLPLPLPSLDLGTVASLCTDLARVVDTRALPAILGRAATVLDAPGVVLWIADPDGRELSPIVTHGYSQQMVARLGTILRDAENVTASAFRTSLMQTVDTDAVSNGAIAAPLVTPAGCVGVMAAEMRHEGEKDSLKLAAAAIVAAQLATLVGPPSTRAQARADAV